MAYDLQEPFRWLVDLSVLEVLRDRRIDRKRDFIVTENYHARLRLAAAKALIDCFSANMNRKVSLVGRNYSFETLVTGAARKLAKHLTAPKSPLDLSYPFAAEEASYVGSDIKERIATMSYAEARNLGISKAGLFSMKWRAAEGKPLRLYSKVKGRLTSGVSSS